MQPYFFPYAGYFQLVHATDLFVIYDNIEYTKKGWISRNRISVNGEPSTISLSLKKGPDHADIVERELANTWKSDRQKLLNRIREAYRKAPHFEQTFSLVEACVMQDETNLFGFIRHSILRLVAHLGLTTEIVTSSAVHADHSLRSQDRVLALCESLGAHTYVNPIGGMALYSSSEFAKRSVELRFVKSIPLEYAQFGSKFVPHLSIIDVLMLLPVEAVREYLATGYELIEGN